MILYDLCEYAVADHGPVQASLDEGQGVHQAEGHEQALRVNRNTG